MPRPVVEGALAVSSPAPDPAPLPSKAGRRLKWTPRVAACGALGLSMLGALGWVTDSTVLLRVRADWAAMKPQTAVCLGLMAAALLWQAGKSTPQLPTRLIGAAIAGLTALVMWEYLAGPVAGLGWAGPRMAGGTAITLFLLAVALSVGPASGSGQAVTLAATVPAYLALVGYAVDSAGLYSFGPYGSMAFETAAAVGLLCVAVLTVSPGCALSRAAVGTDIGSHLIRRLLPAGLTLFPALTAVAVEGARRSWWTESFALSLATIGSSASIVALILWTARTVTSMDRHRRQAADLADRDPLTGISNRRSFERVLTNLVLSPGARRGAAVLALDLDDFKMINDRYGHHEGDLTLQEFTQLAGDLLRPSDVLARLGGDEFAVLLPDTSRAGAREVASRLVAAFDAWHTADPRRPGVSMGLAFLDETVQSGDDLHRRADLALYRAKSDGKGRLSAFPDPTTTRLNTSDRETRAGGLGSTLPPP